MLRISNVTKGRSDKTRVGFSSKFGRTTNTPMLFNLGPGEFIDILRQTFHQLHVSVKEHVAEFVANDILNVSELDSAHKYQDKGNNSKYNYDYLVTVGSDTFILDHALNMADDLHDIMNRHFNNKNVHNITTANISASKPTNQASLLTWVAAVQTAFTTHRSDAAAHPFLDTENTLSVGVPATLAQAITAMQEIYNAFHNHKTWVVQLVTLDIPGILTY